MASGKNPRPPTSLASKRDGSTNEDTDGKTPPPFKVSSSNVITLGASRRVQISRHHTSPPGGRPVGRTRSTRYEKQVFSTRERFTGRVIGGLNEEKGSFDCMVLLFLNAENVRVNLESSGIEEWDGHVEFSGAAREFATMERRNDDSSGTKTFTES
ncbi:unnamed protein product [Sphagnum jensenii]|uniref:Photosystem II reaction center Psb28 protein n=1 Tax=Sphagnum jensenii TaxID=128206 RepID=A0ABP0VIL4_9BRYO